MQTPASSLNALRRPILALLFLAISALHFAAAYVPGPARNWHGETSEYYPLLTDAFLAGRTSLLIAPDPRLLALPDPYDPVANANYRLHDASLYRGRYYLYFGPAPAIVLFLPYKLLTGSYLPTRAAVALFSIGGFGYSCLLFFRLARWEKWICPLWLESLAVLSFGASSFVLFLLTRPSFYETAISSAYCFLMGGFALLAYSLAAPAPRLSGLLFSGLCFGLAAGSRPTGCVLAALLAVLVAVRLRSYRLPVLTFVFPIAICGVLLVWYNYARFQNPLEFGMRYSLLASATDSSNHFSRGLRNLLPSLSRLLFARPWDDGNGPSAGLLWGAPMALAGLLLPLLLLDRRVSASIRSAAARFTILSVYASAAAILALLSVWGFTLGRYDVDFAPEFVVAAWLLVAGLWQMAPRWEGTQRWLFRAAACGLTLYSVVLDFGACWQRLAR